MTQFIRTGCAISFGTVLLEMKCRTHRVKLTPCRLILGMI